MIDQSKIIEYLQWMGDGSSDMALYNWLHQPWTFPPYFGIAVLITTVVIWGLVGMMAAINEEKK